MTTPKKARVVKLPTAQAPKPKPAPQTKRLSIELPAQLHADLAALAEAQRRDLKQQVLVILETAVKSNKGQQRSRARKERIKREWYGDER